MSWVYFYPERRNAFLSDFLGFFCSPKKTALAHTLVYPQELGFTLWSLSARKIGLYYVVLAPAQRSLQLLLSICRKLWDLSADSWQLLPVFFFIPSKNLPVVHEAINHWVVHGVGHSKPINCQVDFLKKKRKQIISQNIFSECFSIKKYLKSGKLFVDGGKKTWGPCSDHKSKTYKKTFFFYRHHSSEHQRRRPFM